MKKTISIYLVLFLISFNSFSQSKIPPIFTDFVSEFSGESNYLKSTNESQQLDSIIRSTYVIENEKWLNKKKSEFIYENGGKTVTEYQYTWDSDNNEWSKFRRHIYNYDDNSNKIEEIQGLWQQESSEWGQGYKEVWTYNSDGLMTLNAKYYWSSSLEIWEGDEREQYTYDEQGNTLEYVYSEWNASDKDFRNFYQQAYEYSAGKLLKYSFSYWNNTNQNWKISSYVDYIYSDGLKILANGFRISNSDTLYSSKMDWSYDENNHPILYRSYSFDDTDSTWYVNSKEEYLNDMSGNKTMIKSYTLNSTIDSLIVNQKRLYTYDENGNNTYEFYSDYEYNFSGDQIVGLDSAGFKNTFEFDNADLLILEFHQQWYSWSDPNKIYKFEYEYDEANYLICRSYYESNASQQWDGLEKYVIDYTDLSNIKQYSYYFWDALTNDWILNNQSSRGIYYYHDDQTLIITQHDFSNISIALYPNPADDYLKIEINDNQRLFNLKLYNAAGQLVIEKMIQGGQLLNISNLNKGLYSCIIKSSEFSYVSKIIKK